MSELPAGWVWTDIAQLCTSITDGDHQAPPQVPLGIPFLVIGNIRNHVLDFSNCRHVTPEYFESLNPIRRPQKGDVLYSLVGSYGIPVLVNDDTSFCVQRHIGILRPSPEVDASFVAMVLSSPAVFNQATEFATGTAQLTVPLSGLRRIRVPLPPRPEQERIVAAIEEQFSRADVGVAVLERARQNLKRMRAAVLQAAVTGRLTAQDPEDPPAAEWLRANGKVISAAGREGYRVPRGWTRTTIRELKTWSLYGPRFSSDDYVPLGTPVLRTTDITEDGRILVDQAPKLMLTPAELKKYRVKVGDVVITRTGSIGTVAFIADDRPAIPGAYLILYRFGLPVQFSEYLFYLLQSPHIQSQLRGKSAGVGRPNLNAPSIDGIAVDVPPWVELVRIIDAVKTQLEAIDRLDRTLRVVNDRVRGLRRSILAAAFSGELVPQHRDDEPACILLERIAGQHHQTANT